MKKKSLIYRLTALAMTALIVAGCGKNDAGVGEKVVLNEVAHSIFYAPLYVAIENGYFEEKGIDLELVTGFGADKTMTAVLSGEADIGFMGPESTIYTYLGGTEDTVVNFAQLTQRAGNFMVAREDDPDFTWDKLKGKTVLGGRAGGMPQMVFEYILRKNGIDPANDVDIVQNIDFGLTAAAFSAGSTEAEYTVEFEPFATSLETEGKGYVIASLGEESGYVPYTAYCVRKSYLESNSDNVQAFTDAIQKGLDFVNTHTAAEIAEVIKPQFKETDIEAITKIVERYKSQDTWKGDTVFEESSYDLLLNILEESGVIESRPEYGKIVTTTYSENAKK